MEQSNKSAGIIGLVALAVLAIGGFLIYTSMNNDETTADSTTSSQTTESTDMEEEEMTTIVDAASANPDFSTLVTAVGAADLTDALSGSDKLTVFAPTNEAFNMLPEGTVASLLQPENKETLTGILTYHVVESEVLSSQLKNGQKVTTLNGEQLTISIENGSVYIVDAKGGRAMVGTADMQVDNGVIHAINSVLMPM